MNLPMKIPMKTPLKLPMSSAASLRDRPAPPPPESWVVADAAHGVDQGALRRVAPHGGSAKGAMRLHHVGGNQGKIGLEVHRCYGNCQVLTCFY